MTELSFLGELEVFFFVFFSFCVIVNMFIDLELYSFIEFYKQYKKVFFFFREDREIENEKLLHNIFYEKNH